MRLSADERGQAIQVGAVLLFAILILAFSSYQAVIIPAENERVEFNHNQAVQSQLAELRNAIVSASSAGGPESVTVALGTNYPTRTLGLNPSPPSGTLRTVGTTDPTVSLEVRNATATDGETADRWDGSPLSYNTGALHYSPNYHRYETAPDTVYDHTVLANDFGDQTLVVANQSFIDGDRLSLVTLNGSLSRSSSTATTVDVRPISSSSETILIEAQDASSPITLNFTSRLSASTWQGILSGQDNVVAVEGYPSAAGSEYTQIRVELATGVTYELQMTKAAVGTGATSEPAAYLTDESGDGSSVATGNSQQLTLTVRDAYNNPVSGVTVNGSVGGSNTGSLATGSQTTDADGQITFTYTTQPSTVQGDHQVNVTIDDASTLSLRPFDQSTPENASLTVTVTAAGGGGGGAYTLEWTDPSTESANSGADLTACDADACTWDVGGSSDNTLTLNGTLDPQFSGIDLSFAVDNTTVGTVPPASATTGSNGAATTELTAAENGTVDVLASANDGSDVITLEVTNVSGGGGQDSSDQMALVSGSSGTFWGGGGVTFQVRNTGSTSVTISDVTVNSTTAGSVARIAEANGGTASRGQHEVYVNASTDGILDMDGQPYSGDSGTPLQIGSREPLTEAGTVDAGTTATVDIYEFRNNGGNTVSMGGETVTVTLHYSDGSAESYTVQP